MNDIVLASSSIGRKKLFQKHFAQFKISVSNIDETKIKLTDPYDLTKRLSYLKAMAVSKFYHNDFVMGFDTIVVCEDRQLGKPRNKEEAIELLKFLSGKYQSVITGFCIIHVDRKIEVNEYAETRLHFKKLSDKFIREYVENNPVTKFAGGYGVQDNDHFVRIEEGTMENVIGAPIDKIIAYLKDWDIYNGLKKELQEPEITHK